MQMNGVQAPRDGFDCVCFGFLQSSYAGQQPPGIDQRTIITFHSARVHDENNNSNTSLSFRFLFSFRPDGGSIEPWPARRVYTTNGKKRFLDVSCGPTGNAVVIDTTWTSTSNRSFQSVYRPRHSHQQCDFICFSFTVSGPGWSDLSVGRFSRSFWGPQIEKTFLPRRTYYTTRVLHNVLYNRLIW